MNQIPIEITPFNLQAASAQEYAAYNRQLNQVRRERLPDDPAIPVEETIQNCLTIPPFIGVFVWVAWDPSHTEIIASGSIELIRLEENQHIAPIEIMVVEPYRRQGIGRHLLRLIAGQAHQENRRLLLTNTTDRIPAGEAFMLRIGGHKGLEAHTNQLRIAELDRSLLAQWLSRSQEHEAEFELGFWDGPYPEEQIHAVAELYELTNQQPLGSLELEDVHMTPENLRQVEHNLFSRGNQRWTFYAVDRSSGKFAGYTETVWNPNRPEILRQDMTGVFPEYRNRGLGRWLKASMLQKVIAERPQVKLVRTGNADSNAAMLKINRELGFTPYTSDALWQVEVQTVLQYLQPAKVEVPAEE